MRSITFFGLLTLILLHLFLLNNTRFTLWPEMMVYPYLINNGFTPYTDIINPYPPAALYFLSVFSKITNYSIIGFQSLTWAIILIADFLIFLFSKKIFGNAAGLISLAFFIIFSIPFSVNGLWFDLIQTPLILVSVTFFFLFTKTKKVQNLDYAFLSLTLATFLKQQALWLITFYAILLLTKERTNLLNLLKGLKFTYSTLLVLILSHLIYLIKLDLFREFFNWVIYFPIKASKLPGYVLLPTQKQTFILLILLLFFFPLFIAKAKDAKRVLILSTPLLFFIYPRFDFFHLIPFLATISMIAGKNIRVIFEMKADAKALSLIVITLMLVFSLRFYYRNWSNEIRFFENDILHSAKILSEVSDKKDRVYVQNGPDQILPLAGRLPPKPWADEFPWYLEGNDLQNKIVKGLENENTKLVIYKPYEGKGELDLGSYKPMQIASYLEENYLNNFRISDTLWLKQKKTL